MGLFAPEKQFSSVAAIDAQWDLLRLHLTHVLLDLDNTLRRRDNDEVPLEVRAWLTHVQQKGIKPCILSNNFHENVFAVARELDIPIVAKAMKPLSSGFSARSLWSRAAWEDSVMVGDQLFTDVVGAASHRHACLLGRAARGCRSEAYSVGTQGRRALLEGACAPEWHLPTR